MVFVIKSAEINTNLETRFFSLLGMFRLKHILRAKRIIEEHFHFVEKFPSITTLVKLLFLIFFYFLKIFIFKKKKKNFKSFNLPQISKSLFYYFFIKFNLKIFNIL